MCKIILLFVRVWKIIFLGLYAKRTGKSLLYEANSLWQIYNNRLCTEVRDNQEIMLSNGHHMLII